jgi:hypothetical protein
MEHMLATANKDSAAVPMARGGRVVRAWRSRRLADIARHRRRTSLASMAKSSHRTREERRHKRCAIAGTMQDSHTTTTGINPKKNYLVITTIIHENPRIWSYLFLSLLEIQTL